MFESWNTGGHPRTILMHTSLRIAPPTKIITKSNAVLCFANISVLRWPNHELTREISEALYIKNEGKCVSHDSVALHETEFLLFIECVRLGVYRFLVPTETL